VIAFHLEACSGVAPYQQIVQQVRHAPRLGLLDVGDQLPTVKEVIATLAINPNTVLTAYKELEHLKRWLAKARRAGLDEESIEALFRDALRSSAAEDVA
jgi:GntR family transcriptional regulator